MTLQTLDLSSENIRAPRTIELPAPTAWPIILAFGLTLILAGLVTSASVSILGAFFAVSGGVGWFFDVLPHEKHEIMAIVETVPLAETSRPQVGSNGRPRNCNGRDCRWRSILFQRVSKVVWQAVWPWPFWQCFME